MTCCELIGSLTLKTRSIFLEGSLQSATRMVTDSSGSDAFPNFLTSCVPVSRAGAGVVGGSAPCGGVWVSLTVELLAELSCAKDEKWNL